MDNIPRRNDKEIYSFLGLAARAGSIAAGTFLTEKAIIAGKAFLVLVAEDAGSANSKKIRDKCEYYDIKYIEFGTMEELGKSTGFSGRNCLAVTDEGFAKGLCKKLTIKASKEDRNGGNRQK